MSMNGMRPVEWKDFEARAAGLRRGLVKTLRRELVHDPRAGAVRRANVAAADLADEAFTWALENWKAKPAATPPEQWTRRHALQLLDEALDREALAAESRAEERDTERRSAANEALAQDDDRRGWLDIASMATREDEGGEVEPFDGLLSDPLVSSPAARFDERETLALVERALTALPDRRRRAIAHRYLDGLSVDEIAYLLDAPASDIRHEIAAGIADIRRGFATQA